VGGEFDAAVAKLGTEIPLLFIDWSFFNLHAIDLGKLLSSWVYFCRKAITLFFHFLQN
jgi:hypothetical protein